MELCEKFEKGMEMTTLLGWWHPKWIVMASKFGHSPN